MLIISKYSSGNVFKRSSEGHFFWTCSIFVVVVVALNDIVSKWLTQCERDITMDLSFVLFFFSWGRWVGRRV